MRKGDIIIVTQEIRDRETQETREWRWYGLVTGMLRPVSAKVYRFSDGHTRFVRKFAPYLTYEILPEDQWPDGIWALRTKAILEGILEI